MIYVAIVAISNDIDSTEDTGAIVGTYDDVLIAIKNIPVQEVVTMEVLE